MKKTRINLLSSRVDYQRIEKYFFYIRACAIGSGILFFVALSYIFFHLNNQNSKIQRFLNQKKMYLLQLQDKKDIEAQMMYIEKKYEVIQQFEKDDVRALPYYNLLITALSQNSQTQSPPPSQLIGSSSANLASMSAQVQNSTRGILKTFFIDKGRNVEFKVAFSNFSSLVDFTKFVESDTFLKNFERLSLKSFSLSNLSSLDQPTSAKERYELSLRGKFILINETNN